MKETSARLLRLLALLQSRREWTGAGLAERLGVTDRTVRRDIDKLRALDYPINAVKGIEGGYRLGAGARLPPLQLDDEEAVAIAIGLRTATGSNVSGLGEVALRALVKLEQVLPDRLRRRIDALRISTVRTPWTEAMVDPEVLTAVAGACRDRLRLRFDYRTYKGTTAVRIADPHELVTWGRRWYLVAWDCQREDWRTFRVDRMRPRIPTGPRFARRDLPDDGDAAAFVARKVARMWPYQTTVRLHIPATSAMARACEAYGRIEPVDSHTCYLHAGAENPRGLAFLLGALDVDFDVDPASDLAEQLRVMTGRFARATGSVEP